MVQRTRVVVYGFGGFHRYGDPNINPEILKPLLLGSPEMVPLILGNPPFRREYCGTLGAHSLPFDETRVERLGFQASAI